LDGLADARVRLHGFRPTRALESKGGHLTQIRGLKPSAQPRHPFIFVIGRTLVPARARFILHRRRFGIKFPFTPPRVRFRRSAEPARLIPGFIGAAAAPNISASASASLIVSRSKYRSLDAVSHHLTISASAARAWRPSAWRI